MADLFISYDPSQPTGRRLAPEVNAEIAFIAPSTVNNGSITANKLADNAVTGPKINAGAVSSPKIGAGEVKTVNLGDGAVSNAKLAGGAVTPDKAGTGIVVARDTAGNPAPLTVVSLTSAQYAALSPNPNTLYLLTD